MSDRTVLLLGATGLVGRELLALLLQEPGVARVRVVSRRPTGTSAPRLEEHVFELDYMAEHPDVFAVDQVFCALGTTIKAAGSQERFRRVDHDYPLAAARLGRQGGARHYLVVTVLGADARSSIFYNRVKGEVEDGLRGLGYRSLTIAQPSFLAGERSERRLGEELARRLSFLLPAKYKSISTRAVARALVESARVDAPGVHVLGSGEMQRYSGP